jgi:hypothetical protein
MQRFAGLTVSDVPDMLYVHATGVRSGEQDMQPVTGGMDILRVYRDRCTGYLATPDVELVGLLGFLFGCRFVTHMHCRSLHGVKSYIADNIA